MKTALKDLTPGHAWRSSVLTTVLTGSSLPNQYWRLRYMTPHSTHSRTYLQNNKGNLREKTQRATNWKKKGNFEMAKDFAEYQKSNEWVDESTKKRNYDRVPKRAPSVWNDQMFSEMAEIFLLKWESEREWSERVEEWKGWKVHKIWDNAKTVYTVSVVLLTLRKTGTFLIGENWTQ